MYCYPVYRLSPPCYSVSLNTYCSAALDPAFICVLTKRAAFAAFLTDLTAITNDTNQNNQKSNRKNQINNERSKINLSNDAP